MGATIRWGLIGAANIGTEWMIPAIREAGGEVVGVMSADRRRGEDYARVNGIPSSTTDLDDLLGGGIDAVYIATTNEKHRQQTVAAAASGKHVLCEKPLAMSLADAAEMIRACREAGVVMATNHHLRNAATHRAMRDAIARGEIGRPLFARVSHTGFLPPRLQTWRVNDPEAGAGVALDVGVHDADTLRFVLGQEPVAVTAFTQNSGMGVKGVEDALMTVIRFEDGLIAQTHDAFTLKYNTTSFEVHATEGSIFAANCMTQQPVGDVRLRNAKGEFTPQLDHENLYVRSVRAFHAAIAGAGEPAATAEDGLRSLAVGLAILESARTGREVPIRIEA